MAVGRRCAVYAVVDALAGYGGVSLVVAGQRDAPGVDKFPEVGGIAGETGAVIGAASEAVKGTWFT